MLTHDDYTVGWISALPLEMAAAKLLLDQIHPKLTQPTQDSNTYVLGEITGHNVVMACLPSGVYGSTSAGTVAQQMLSTFRSIRFGMMVGIGGGVPSDSVDIRLGDVVVSKPTGVLPGVVQYDYGKTIMNGHVERTGTLNRPPQSLLTALSDVESQRLLGRSQFERYIAESLERSEFSTSVFKCPGRDEDKLYNALYEHDPCFSSCSECDPKKLVKRKSRHSQSPIIHCGIIASGNQVMKHGLTRNRIAQELGGIFCFEMEAAGLMDHFPCIVIRGICDYCDSHKNKKWQGYAALTAAAFAKELLSNIPITETAVSKQDRSPTHLRDSFTVRFESLNLPLIECFVGRDKELAEIYGQLRSPNSTRTVIMYGLGGIGKTQLAVAYALRHRHEYSAIFWFDASDVTKLVNSFLTAARRIRIDHESFADFGSSVYNDDPFKAVKAVNDWLSKKHNLHWLLIFDNYTASKTDKGYSELNTDLRSCLPGVLQGHVLITTRFSGSDFGHPVKIRELDDPKHGLEILSASSKRPSIYADPYAHELTKELDGVPLALASAGAYMSQIATSPRDYLQLYRDSWHHLQESSPQLPEYERAMHSTWSISYSQIYAQNDLACLLLEYWVFLDSQDLWRELLYDTSKPWTDGMLNLLSYQSTFNEAMRVLCDYGMVGVSQYIADDSTQSQGYRLNKCVHSWAFHYLRSEQRSTSAWRVLHCVARYSHQEDSLNERVYQRLLPHANRLLQLISDGALCPDRESLEVVGLIYSLGGLHVKASERISLRYSMYLNRLNVDYLEKWFLTGFEIPYQLALKVSTELEVAHDLKPFEKQYLNEMQISTCVTLAINYDYRLEQFGKARKWYEKALDFHSKGAEYSPNDERSRRIRLRIKEIWFLKHFVRLVLCICYTALVVFFIFLEATLPVWDIVIDVVYLIVIVGSWSALMWRFIKPWKALCLYCLSIIFYHFIHWPLSSPTGWRFYAFSILALAPLAPVGAIMTYEIISRGSYSLRS